MKDEITGKLEKLDWGDIAKKLTAFVINYMNYCSGKKFNTWNLPEGYKPEDVASKAIVDVLTGKRNWNPEKYPNFLLYMQFSVCRSIISNLYSKSSIQHNTTPRSASKEYNEASDFEFYNQECINLGLEFEQYIDNEIFLDEMEKALKDDEIGQLVLLSILDGNPTRIIAKELGINENEVTNTKKRIKRAAEKVLITLNTQK